MIRKYHKHKLRTNPQHHKEDTHKNRQSPVRQIKHSKQFPFPHEDDFKNRINIRGSFFMFVESGCISTNVEFTVP